MTIQDQPGICQCGCGKPTRLPTNRYLVGHTGGHPFCSSIDESFSLSFPSDFGHWLAGFVDGEGCFLINIARHADQPVGYTLRFTLALRDDDRAVLETIRDTTGAGRVYGRKLPTNNKPGAKPLAEWIVFNQPDLIKLVHIFDRFPLRSKKARDFAIWRGAVLYRATLGKGRPANWGPIEEMRDRLQGGKLYRAPDSEPVAEPRCSQLALGHAA